MRVLTVKQPHAGAIFVRGKCVENRSWPTQYRGPLVIHAAASFDADAAMPLRAMRDSEHPTWRKGAILGVVELVDCVSDAKSKWAIDGQWHWILKHPIMLSEPIPAKGRLSLWQLDAATRRKLAKQILGE